MIFISSSYDSITSSQIVTESSIIHAKYFPFSQLHVAEFYYSFSIYTTNTENVFSTAVRGLVAATLVLLCISPLASFMLALKEASVAKLVILDKKN